MKGWSLLLGVVKSQINQCCIFVPACDERLYLFVQFLLLYVHDAEDIFNKRGVKRFVFGVWTLNVASRKTGVRFGKLRCALTMAR